MTTSNIPLMDDAVVPSSRVQTPLSRSPSRLSSMIDSPQTRIEIDSPLVGVGELLMLMESRPHESDSRRIGERLFLLISTYAIVPNNHCAIPIDRIIEALRWIFVDWSIAGIVSSLKSAHLPSEIECKLLIGLTHDWQCAHVAELLAVMYFVPNGGNGRRKIAISFLKRIPRERAVRIVAHLRTIIQFNHN